MNKKYKPFVVFEGFVGPAINGLRYALLFQMQEAVSSHGPERAKLVHKKISSCVPTIPCSLRSEGKFYGTDGPLKDLAPGYWQLPCSDLPGILASCRKIVSYYAKSQEHQERYHLPWLKRLLIDLQVLKTESLDFNKAYQDLFGKTDARLTSYEVEFLNAYRSLAGKDQVLVQELIKRFKQMAPQDPLYEVDPFENDPADWWKKNAH